MTGYLAFGNDEIDAAPEIPEEAACPGCDGEHVVDMTTSGEVTIHTIACPGVGSYFIGLNGKDLRQAGSSGDVDLEEEP